MGRRRSCCRSTVKYICSFFLGLLLMVGVPVLIVALSPLYLIRWFVAKLGPLLNPELGKILHSRGATLSVDNIYGGIPKCNIFVAGIVDGHLPLEVFRANVSRVILSKNPDGSFANPEIQQIVTSYMGYHFWKWDEEFKVENHVKHYDGLYAEQVAKEGLHEDFMTTLASEWIRTPFVPNRSPWEAFLVNNLIMKDGDPVNKPKSLLVLRIHHCMADGLALLRIITIDLMLAQYEQVQAAYFKRSIWRKVFDGVSYLVKAPFEGAHQFIESLDFNEWHIPESQLSHDYHVGVTGRLPLGIIKELKNQFNTSFTTILLAAFAGGIRKFMLDNGYKVPRAFHCLTPLPMPGHPSKLRNHLTLCVIALPLDIEDPYERIEELAAELERIRTSSVPISLFLAGPLFGALPPPIIKMTFKNFATTAVLTSMPGPDRVIDFLGCPLDDIVFGGGMLAGNCGLGLSSLSYNGAIRIGTGLDKSIIKSQEKINELVQNIQDELSNMKNYINV